MHKGKNLVYSLKLLTCVLGHFAGMLNYSTINIPDLFKDTHISSNPVQSLGFIVMSFKNPWTGTNLSSLKKELLFL